MDIQSSYMPHKIFDELAAIRKNKVTLTLNDAAYIGMCISELSKVLMYEFYYDYIKNKYGNNSRLLFTDNNSLMYESKTEYVYEDFSNNKEMFDLSNCSTKIEEFIGLKLKMYSYLVNDNSEHKKAKGVNTNVIATICHNEHKNVLLNKKCLRNSMKRIQSKDHKIETYEINKISLFRFDDKIYIQNNGYDG